MKNVVYRVVELIISNVNNCASVGRFIGWQRKSPLGAEHFHWIIVNNQTVWDEEKVACYVSDNGDVFCGVIGVKRYVVGFIHCGITVENLRGKPLISLKKANVKNSSSV